MRSMLRLGLLVIPSLLVATPASASTDPIRGGFEVKRNKVKKQRKPRTTAPTPVATPTGTMSAYNKAPSAPSSVLPTPGAAMIMAYKRDPVPIFDESGSKLRDVPKGQMPKANTAAARVLGTKPGFVAIMLDGQRAWVRLTAVDYAGNVSAPPCEKVVIATAKMEEDGVERSLGLGCKKN